MHLFMFVENTFITECFITFTAGKWFLTSVDSFVRLQILCLAEFPGTLCATERFITIMKSLVNLQTKRSAEFFVTPIAAERFFVHMMTSFMFLQIS